MVDIVNKMGQAIVSELGYKNSDKLLVIHADDVGLTSSSIDSAESLFAGGHISSASVMVNTPWMPLLMKAVSKLPNSDIGVHLTLNSEWPDYKLRPLAGVDASSLCNSTGFFYPLASDTVKYSSIEHVYQELKCQVLMALNSGIFLTHIDSHMLSLLHPKFLGLYIDLSIEFGLPCLIPSLSADQIFNLCCLDLEASKQLSMQIKQAFQRDQLFLDYWVDLPLNGSINRLEKAKQILDDLPTGISVLVAHPAQESNELRSIASDWEARVADDSLLRSDQFKYELAIRCIKVVGMREIRDAWKRLSF
jgi:predicted glycoside hydrolase/deacetylase ChbG (UPF0249 family)